MNEPARAGADKPISDLRRRMIADMTVRSFSDTIC
jgi:hypothetical protein